MTKWVEIASTVSRLRFDTLSQCLNDQGFPNQVTYVETNKESFQQELQKAMAEADHIRIGSPFGEVIFQTLPQFPIQTLSIRTADAMMKKEGRWWPRTLLTEGIAQEVALIEKLDISETALVVGAGSSCRAVIAALMKMGFQKFNITEQFVERGEALVKELKTLYFDVDFRFTPPSGITHLPGIHSIIVNTTPLIPSNDILGELYYCNFLKPQGVAIDLALLPTETPLLKAVKQVEGRTVCGYEVAAFVEAYWAKNILGFQLDHKIYAQKLKEKCDATPFDLAGLNIPEF